MTYIKLENLSLLKSVSKGYLLSVKRGLDAEHLRDQIDQERRKMRAYNNVERYRKANHIGIIE